jgi:hypothetical protein
MKPCACDPEPMPGGCTSAGVQSIEAVGGAGDDHGTMLFMTLRPSQRGSFA